MWENLWLSYWVVLFSMYQVFIYPQSTTKDILQIYKWEIEATRLAFGNLTMSIEYLTLPMKSIGKGEEDRADLVLIWCKACGVVTIETWFRNPMLSQNFQVCNPADQLNRLLIDADFKNRGIAEMGHLFNLPYLDIQHSVAILVIYYQMLPITETCLIMVLLHGCTPHYLWR